MYNLNQLWTFVKVAELGSFNKAAEEHFISPNAVLKQMNNLEIELGGVKLFKRSKKGNELTREGSMLYQDAKFILEYCEESKKKITNTAYNEDNTVRIGVADGTPTEMFDALWIELHRRYPDIRVEIVPVISEHEEIDRIWQNFGKIIDITFCVIDDGVLDTTVHSGLELKKTSLFCQMSVTHPLAVKKKIALEDLKGQDVFIITTGWSNSADALRKYIMEKQPETNLIEKAFYGMDMYNQVANGGAMVIGVYDLKKRHPFLCNVPLEWEMKNSYGLIYSNTPTKAVKKFIAAVSEILEEKKDFVNIP